MRVARLGNLTYNGRQLPIATKSSLVITAVRDSSDRTTKYLQYNFHSEFIVTGSDIGGNDGDALDALMPDYLLIITSPGETFTLSGQGIGDLTINYQTCIGFGPTPKVVHWEPIGANLAAKIIWECEFILLACPTGTNPFAEFTYTVNWSCPYTGYTRRTISGRAEKWVKRGSDGGTSVDSSADDLFTPINNNFPTIPGFKRDFVRTLSADRRFLDFSITDDEIQTDNPYPPSILDASCSHTVSGGMGNKDGLFRWQAHFEGSFLVPPGVPKALAVAGFFTIIQDRMGAINSSSGSSQTAFVSLRVSITEDIFTNRISCSLSYGLLIPTMGQLISYSGLFRPTPFDWNTWSLSVQNIMGGNGTAQLSFNSSQDQIVTLCSPPPYPGYQSGSKAGNSNQQATVPAGGCPTGDYGWTGFKTWLEVEQQTGLITNQKLGQGTSGPTIPQQFITPVMDAGNDVGLPTLSGGGFSNSNPSSSISAVQIRTPGTAYLILTGYAFRIGQPCFASTDSSSGSPRVLTIGGNTAILYRVDYDQQRIIAWTTSGCAWYGAWWRKVYVLTSIGSNQVVNIFGIPIPYLTANFSQQNVPGVGPPPAGQ